MKTKLLWLGQRPHATCTCDIHMRYAHAICTRQYALGFEEDSVNEMGMAKRKGPPSKPKGLCSGPLPSLQSNQDAGSTVVARSGLEWKGYLRSEFFAICSNPRRALTSLSSKVSLTMSSAASLSS